MLPPHVNRVRLIVVDILSFAFCAFFALKAWTLLHEAIVDNFHSGSTWGPPLWVPYSLMTAGMALLDVTIIWILLAAALLTGSTSSRGDRDATDELASLARRVGSIGSNDA